MLSILKNYFLFIFILSLSLDVKAEINPHEFIDSKAQEMVQVLKENSELFYIDRDAYEDKIKVIFEPIIDFRRVSALVMGKKYYVAATKEQRAQFIEVFKNSHKKNY